MSEENRNPKYIYDSSDVNLFNLLEDRRLEAQRQMEQLHKRIGDLRDELYEEVATSHKEIMKEIRELKAEQRAHANEMSERIRILEHWKWLIVGGGAVLGFVVAIGLDVAKLFG